MTSPIPRLKVRFGEDIGSELFFGFPDLKGETTTYLDNDSAIGAGTLTANGVDLSVGQYIVLGQPGNEKTEIVQVHSSTPPTATTITLVGITSFAHNRGDGVRVIPENQIVPEFSTDGINFTPALAISIRPDATETYLQRPSDLATYSYRFRFLNSTTGLYSAESSIVLATGLADNTVGAVKKRALDQLGEKRGNLITDDFLNDCLMEARRIADFNPAVLRWSFRQKFGVVIGQMLSGQYSIPAPADLRDRNTYKNILSLRMGNQNRPITYQDERRFNQNYLNVVHATVATQATSGQTTIVLSSTHDLDATGSVYLANNSVGDGLIAISYTGNNKGTNTLSGIPVSGSGSINRTVLVGTDVWQRPIWGLPVAYTITGGIIYFDTPLKLDYDGQDLKGDYYKTIPIIATDSDVFDEDFYDLYVPYLKFKIKSKKANGKINRDGDTDWKDWETGLFALINQQVGGQFINLIPDTEGFLSSNQ